MVAAGGHNSRAVEVLISGIWSELDWVPCITEIFFKLNELKNLIDELCILLI